MPHPRHYYQRGHYHYLTENIYQRARIFDSDRFTLEILLPGELYGGMDRQR